MSQDERSITLMPLEAETLIEYGVSRLQSFCHTMGIKADAQQLRICVEHLLYVIQVNEYMNLTRITDFDEALILHILDSLTLLPYMPVGTSQALDMGTGAGFPGIPLAAVSDCSWTLLDSVGKKIKAVQAFGSILRLRNVDGYHDRIESFAAHHKQEFDLVVARALAPLPVLLEYARPLLHVGGSLLVSKGCPDEEELSSSVEAAKILGYVLDRQDEFELPANAGHRTVMVYRVTRPSQVKLPRANGLARKKPLA